MNGIDWSPVWISMKVAGITILITFFLGLGAAWFVCRRKKEISKAVWDGIFTMPLVLPPTVVGFVLLYLFGVNGPAGKFFLQFFGVKIAFSQTAAVLAAVVISFPLMYRSARGAIEQVEPNLLRAGRTLGMTEWQIFYSKCTAGNYFRRNFSFCKGIGRIRCNCHDRGKYSGENKNTAACGIFGNGGRKYGNGRKICRGYSGYLLWDCDRDESVSCSKKETDRALVKRNLR